MNELCIRVIQSPVKGASLFIYIYFILFGQQTMTFNLISYLLFLYILQLYHVLSFIIIMTKNLTEKPKLINRLSRYLNWLRTCPVFVLMEVSWTV